MSNRFPGTTIEFLKPEKGSSRVLFDGIFATGGITLSQVSVMTGLEPYLIQNWVKRGFLTPPRKRVYSKKQFARIIIINMLRESLQLERICSLVDVIGWLSEDTGDDTIGDDELYHMYFDMLTESKIDISDPESISLAAERAAEKFDEKKPHTRRQLMKILEVMTYAHYASELRRSAEEILSSLK